MIDQFKIKSAMESLHDARRVLGDRTSYHAKHRDLDANKTQAIDLIGDALTDLGTCGIDMLEVKKPSSPAALRGGTQKK